MKYTVVGDYEEGKFSWWVVTPTGKGVFASPIRREAEAEAARLNLTLHEDYNAEDYARAVWAEELAKADA